MVWSVVCVVLCLCVVYFVMFVCVLRSRSTVRCCVACFVVLSCIRVLLFNKCVCVCVVLFLCVVGWFVVCPLFNVGVLFFVLACVVCELLCDVVGRVCLFCVVACDVPCDVVWFVFCAFCLRVFVKLLA